MIFEAMGKSFTLKYDFNAICKTEEVSGKSFTDILNGSYSSMRYLLWGGLVKNHRSITFDEVGKIYDDFIANGKSFEDVVKMIFDELVACGFINTNKNNENSEESEEDSLGEQKPERDST